MMKTISAALAATTLLAGSATAAAAYPAGIQKAVAQPGEATLTQVQYGYRSGGCYPREPAYDCRERLRWERRHGSRYEYRDNRYYSNRNDSGAAIAGAILGFALGAAITGSDNDRVYYNNNRNNRSWQSRCAHRYRSFDYRTGTYLTSNGYRRYCRL